MLLAALKPDNVQAIQAQHNPGTSDAYPLLDVLTWGTQRLQVCPLSPIAADSQP